MTVLINMGTIMSLLRTRLMKATIQILGTLFSVTFLAGCERATEGVQYAKNRDDPTEKSLFIGFDGNETDVVIPDSVTTIGGSVLW